MKRNKRPGKIQRHLNEHVYMVEGRSCEHRWNRQRLLVTCAYAEYSGAQISNHLRSAELDEVLFSLISRRRFCLPERAKTTNNIKFATCDFKKAKSTSCRKHNQMHGGTGTYNCRDQVTKAKNERTEIHRNVLEPTHL